MSDKPNILDKVFKGKTSVFEAFLNIGKLKGESREFVKQLVRLLPQPIKEAPVSLDTVTEIWRYNYGTPYEIGNKFVTGTNVFIDVSELYNAIYLATKYLTNSELLLYLRNLENPDKHNEFRFEMRPLLHIKKLRRNPEYEISGLHQKKIDWRIRFGVFTISFEVKYRLVKLLESLEEISSAVDAGTPVNTKPTPDISVLFRNVEEKFPKTSGLFRIQGVWLSTKLKVSKTDLENYFNSHINEKKVQFCIISDWENKALIMTRKRFQKRLLKKVFGLHESPDFTY